MIKAINMTKISRQKMMDVTPITRNTLSLSLFTLLISRTILSFNPIAYIIEDKGEDKKGNTGRKNCPISRGSMRYITHTHLHNIGGNRFDGYRRIKGKARLLSRCYGHNHCFSYGTRNRQYD